MLPLDTIASFRTFSAMNRRRADYWHGGVAWTRADWMTAALGELGEAANYAKKLKRIEDGLAGNRDEDRDADVLREKMCEELADFVTYLDLLVSYDGQQIADYFVTPAGWSPSATQWTRAELFALAPSATQWTRAELFALALSGLGRAVEEQPPRRYALLGYAVAYAERICSSAGRDLFDEMCAKFDRVSERVGYHERIGETVGEQEE